MKKNWLIMTLATAAAVVIPSLLPAQVLKEAKGFGKEVFSSVTRHDKEVLTLKDTRAPESRIAQKDASPIGETYGERVVRIYKENGWQLPYPEEQMLKFRRVKAPANVEVVPPEEPLHFTGFLQYSMVNGQMNLDYGLYKFNTANGLKRERLADVDWCVNLGGVYYNHRLHGISAIPLPYDGGDGRNHYVEYDADTWTPMERNGMDAIKLGIKQYQHTRIDFNPIDGMCYGFTPWGDYAKFDYESNEFEVIKETDIELSAFAINSKGEGYAIQQGGILLKVDLPTGNLTTIGKLDAKVYNLIQSMTFDRKTDRLYYAVSMGFEDDSDENEEESFFGALLEIDTQTAKTIIRGIFPEDEEYTVLHFVDQPSNSAPADISDLKMVYSGDSCEGLISFTMPSKTVGGDDMDGEISYEITLNDDQSKAIKGSANSGSLVEVSAVAPSEGRNKVVVVLTNDGGSGNRNAIESWAGYDTPKVENVRFTYDATTGNADVEWSLASKHGGFVNPSEVCYKIVRYPDDVVMAENLYGTSFSDNIQNVTYAGYYYKVVPYLDGEEGLSDISNVNRIGNAFEVPYKEDFESDQARYAFTVVDRNNDGNTWAINDKYVVQGEMAYKHCDNDADDWALTPPIVMEGGYVYNLGFKVSGLREEVTEKISVLLGEGEDVSDYVEAMPEEDINSSWYSNPIDTVVRLLVNKDGDYRVAFRCTSPSTAKTLFIDNIIIEKGPHQFAPQSISNLQLTPEEEGGLSVMIDFDLSSINNIGENLDKISKIEIARGENREIVETIESALPGAHISIVDEDAINGNITYYVTPYNEYGPGETVEASVYVGVDSPTEPINIKISDNLNGTATIIWDAPSIGQHGGYVESDDVIYSVFVYDPENGLEEIISDLDETKAIVDIPEEGVQQQMFFYLKAINELGESEVTAVPSIKVGTPYPMPFTEGFVMGNLSGLWIINAIENESAEAAIFGGETPDGDNSLAGGMAYEPDSWASLTSANISLKNIQRPMLVFSRMSTPGSDNTLKVIIRRNGGFDSETVLTFNDKDYNEDQNWQIVKYDLSNYKDAKYIDVTFLFEFNDMDYPYVLIDDVNFVDVKDDDVAVFIDVPYHATVGDKVKFDVTVFNVGDKDADPFSVNVYVDGEKTGFVNVESVSSFMRSRGIVEYTVSHKNNEATEVWAEVVYAKDMNPENDYSDYKTMKVVAPLCNTPENLAASVEEEGVALSWTEPNPVNTITESFEGYGSFITEGFGGWNTWDGDEYSTYSIDGLTFPHSGEAFAFMTFDFECLGVSNPLYAGHSGSQVALSMMGSSNNDDWLISPELSGDKQTITIYVRSMNSYFSATYEILYSNSGKEIADFVDVVFNGAFDDGDEEWKEISVELPEGAKYFAVRNTGYMGGMFMVDDITYTGKPLTLEGYNIYCDGELIGNTDASTPAFTADLLDGKHTYNVTAVYAAGESGFSNGAEVDLSGIESIDADASKDGNVYDLFGRQMPSDRKLEKGVYIRDHKKVLVK